MFKDFLHSILNFDISSLSKGENLVIIILLIILGYSIAKSIIKLIIVCVIFLGILFFLDRTTFDKLRKNTESLYSKALEEEKEGREKPFYKEREADESLNFKTFEKEEKESEQL